MSADPTAPARCRFWYRRLTHWLPAVVLVALVAGCGGSSTDSGATPPTQTDSSGDSSGTTPESSGPETTKVTPPPAAPDAATCRDLGYSDTTVFTNDTKPEPCSKPHTAYTYAVPTLPNAVAFQGVQIQNAAVQTAAADRCRAAFGTFIGGSQTERALSRLTFTYFLPEQADFDLGAHWVRCDVVARQSGTSLADLPGRVAGFLNRPNALDTYGVCSRGNPGPAATLVMCSQEHTYRALAAIRLGSAEAAYPGTDTTLTDGKQHCQDLVANLLGVTGGFTYTWTYPSNEDWLAGQRFGYCWNATDH